MLITREKLRDFARMDLSREELVPSGLDEVTFEEYEFTLDDLKHVLDKTAVLELSADEFYEDWFYWLRDAYIADMIGTSDYFYEDPETFMSEDNLLHTDTNTIFYVLDHLNIFYDFEEEPTDEQFLETIHEMQDTILCYLSNQNLPMTDWEFPTEIKDLYVDYVYYCENKSIELTPDQVTLFYRYMDDLMEEGSIFALKIMAFMHYGGSSLYPCDWELSRQCFHALYEITQGRGFGNELGKIYYYGYCNDSVPEYDKAFPYFVSGYVNGVNEAALYLADMYRNGLGVEKSRGTFINMIEKLYPKAQKEFLHKWDRIFPEVCLRMGEIREEAYHNPTSAYKYYLQAAYAMDNGAYNNEETSKRVKESLERTKDLVEHIEGSVILGYEGTLLSLATADKQICLAKIEKTDSQALTQYRMIIQRKDPDALKMLVTVPEADYCKEQETIDLYFESEEDLTGEYLFNEYSFDVETDTDIFCLILKLWGEKVLRINAEDFYFRCI